jgi:RNA-directed DNA polymerase
VVKRKTSKSRFHRSLRTLADWCRKNRHQPLKVQHQILSQKLQGHYAYYGITGNSKMLSRFRSAAKWLWQHWPSRRRRGRRILGIGSPVS